MFPGTKTITGGEDQSYFDNPRVAGSNPAGSISEQTVSRLEVLLPLGGIRISPAGSDARKTAQVRILPVRKVTVAQLDRATDVHFDRMCSPVFDVAGVASPGICGKR
jgi:hypothetical protein